VVTDRGTIWLEIFKSLVPANDLEFRYGVNGDRTVRIEGLTLGGR